MGPWYVVHRKQQDTGILTEIVNGPLYDLDEAHNVNASLEDHYPDEWYDVWDYGVLVARGYLTE
jgi:hypothetical protein